MVLPGTMCSDLQWVSTSERSQVDVRAGLQGQPVTATLATQSGGVEPRGAGRWRRRRGRSDDAGKPARKYAQYALCRVAAAGAWPADDKMQPLQAT